MMVSGQSAPLVRRAQTVITNFTADEETMALLLEGTDGRSDMAWTGRLVEEGEAWRLEASFPLTRESGDIILGNMARAMGNGSTELVD